MKGMGVDVKGGNLRIVLIRLTALGDVVLTEPVVRALRAHFPDLAIDFITEARFAPLARDAFGFDTVIGYDRHGSDGGWLGMSRMIARLPARSYAAVIDLQGKVRTRLLALRIRADRRIVLRKRSLIEGIRSLVGRGRPIEDRHATEIYLSALAPLGVSKDLCFDGTPRLAAPGARLLSSGGEGTPRGAALRVGLCPGATHATKRWPEKRFAALAKAIDRCFPGASFVLVGGPDDSVLLDAIRREASGDIRFSDEDATSMDVAELAGLIASLDLLISVDTGPAHLGAALGVPVVVIFGPTSPVRWGPRGSAHRIVSLGLECSPCSNMGDARCPLRSRSHACMQDLGVDRVVAAALAVLSARVGQGPRLPLTSSPTDAEGSHR